VEELIMNKKGGGLLVAIIILAVVCIVFLAAGFMILRAWGGFDWWREIPENVKNVEEYSISQTQTASVGSYDTFEFSTVSADIDIIYAQTDTITVELKGSYRSARGQVELRKDTSGNKVHIYVKYPRTSGIFSWNDTDLTITMPMNMEGKDLKFNSVSGEVDISTGLKADEISAHTTSGDVQADDLECNDFNCTSVSGKLDLSGSVANRIDVNTVSGDADISLNDQADRIKVNGVSSEVTVTLPRGTEFRFEYDTVSGDFNCDFPVYTQGGKNDRSGYTSDGADMEIDIDTVSGDLNIRN
jgi:lia operon protein LiaG